MAFITDHKKTHTLTDGSILPRYTAWKHDKIKGKPKVVDVSNDLKYLMTKYKISDMGGVITI